MPGCSLEYAFMSLRVSDVILFDLLQQSPHWGLSLGHHGTYMCASFVDQA
jgi:hypothetical protein